MKDSINYPKWDGTEACVGVDVNLFFSDETRTIYQMRTELNKLREICFSCHRLNECREYAIKHEGDGFWGGMGQRERREYRSKHKITLVRPELFSDCIPKFNRNGESNDSQYATD